MIFKLKERTKNNKWKDISIDKIKDKTVGSFIEESFEPVVGIVYKDNMKDVLFVLANTADMEKECEENSIPLIFIDDVRSIMDSQIGTKVLAEIFPDSTFIRLTTIKPDVEI